MSTKNGHQLPAKETDGNPIEALSSQPLGGSNWLQRAQFAAQELFNATAIALVAQAEPGTYLLAGIAFGDGRLLLEPPDQLEYFSTGEHLAGLANTPYRAHTLDEKRLQDFELPAKEALFLPWPLGMQPNYAFVIFGVSHTKAQHSLHSNEAFLSIASNLLRRATKRALVDAGAWIEAEIQKLATLQNLLQPADLTELAGVAFAVHSRPHAYAGGDYYDIAHVTDNNGETRCLISVADVSGHGPAAVVETAMIDSILRTFSEAYKNQDDRGPGEVMNYLNRHMFTRRPRPTFATMFASELNLSTGRMRYCLAGHPPPILKTADNASCEVIPSGDGIPLQIIREYRWHSLSLELAPGDLFVAYSDGVTETLSPGGVQFGIGKLIDVIETGSSEPQTLLDEILSALDNHAEGRPYHDDQTIVIAKRCDG